jgi:antitoxin VapB
MTVARVFRNGNSQAVRLPKEYRFPPGVKELTIRREGHTVVLEPVQPVQWPEDFWQAFGALDDEFERPPQHGQRRPELEL